MRFLSMFSGIDAASVAWNPLGWKAAAFCEIEPFPSSVLAHHYPDTPNLGDVTKADFDGIGPIDLAVFGSPCQSFSVAGLRLGLDDARGNLALLAGRIVYRKRPRWFVFENVPGLLSSDGGWDFGTLLAAFAGYPSGSVFAPPADGWGTAGVVVQADGQSYGLAWRVLDAQYFGVAQRRRRVFVVGHLGDWRRAAAVLFEPASLRGDPAPRREAGKTAPTIPSRSSAGGGLGADFDCDGGLIASTGETAHCLNAGGMGRQDFETETLVTHTLRGEGYDASEDGSGRGTPLVPVAFAIQERAVCENPAAGPDGAGFRSDGAAYTLEARTVPQAVAFSIMPMNSGKDYKAREVDVAQPFMAAGPTGGNQGGDFILENPIAFALRGRDGGAMPEINEDGDSIGALRSASGGSSRDYVAFAHQGGGTQTRLGYDPDSRTCQTLGSCQTPAIAGSAVRRLTPTECERLQGFPDNYTLVPHRGKPAADGPRYKALGNSMAVPVMAWIGRRIAMVEKTDRQAVAA